MTINNAAYTSNKKGRRQRLDILWSSLERERSSFITHWRSLADYILPRRQQFQVTDNNRGERRDNNIVNNTATLAARTLRAGMMGGVTSPARPWYKLTTSDTTLSEVGAVKEWLHTVTKLMNTVFLKSNLYNALPIVYGDLGTFATAAVLIEEDFDHVVRFYPFPIGSYSIGTDARLKVSVFAREFQLTVRQLIDKFGILDEHGNVTNWSNFSSNVQSQYKDGQLEVWIDVFHVIQPNQTYDPTKLESKRYLSLYYEKSNVQNTPDPDPDSEVYLREAGYDYFPVLVPRWETTGEDVYGTSCPGMTALGDVRGLQTLMKRKAQAIEKTINPPMTGPSSLKTAKATILPGDITYDDSREGTKGFRPVHEVRLDLKPVLDDIREHEFRIKEAYYVDLFLMLANTDRRQITAREIDERHEEKLLVLGPVLEQLNQDLLDPLIDITFDIMMRQGLIPPPPEELQGQDLKVEYISIMHSAQKLAGLAAIERFAGFVTDMGTVKPDVMDKMDTDQLVDEYADITGVPPTVVVSDERVAELRAARAEVEARQAQAEQLASSAGVAKDLAGADLEGNNALSALVKQSQAGALQ